MVEIPDVYMDMLLEKRAFAHLATVMPDGSPQNTPVWFDFTDGKIRVNSALGRTKVRNMKLGAKVALSIMDPDNPDRYVQLRGTVTAVAMSAAWRRGEAAMIWSSYSTIRLREASCGICLAGWWQGMNPPETSAAR